MLLAIVLLLVFLVAIAAGFIGSLVGLGGGVVIVPALVILFNVPFPDAVGASLVAVLATSITSGAAYVEDHLTDLRVGMFLEIATVPGALVGAVATVFLATHGLEAAAMIAFGVVLLLTLPGALSRRSEEIPTPGPPDRVSRALGLEGTYHDQRLDREVAYRAERTAPALGVMFGAGVVSALFGIGGGVLKVFALERELNLPMKISTATSNFMIGVTVAAGASVLLIAGYVNPVLAAPVALGTALGSYTGSRILPGFSNVRVRAIFVPVLLVLALEIILRGLGLP